MSKPDWCPQRVWDEAREATANPPNYNSHVRDAHCIAVARAILAAEQREREACVAVLNDKAAATPLGHESRQRGASTFNWLTYCAGLIATRGSEND